MQAQGGEGRVNKTIAGFQDRSAITALSNGGYVVLWQSNHDDNIILGLVHDASGNLVGNEFHVNPNGTRAFIPSVAALPGGGFVATWQTIETDGSPGVFAQRFDSDGGTVGAARHVNTYTAQDQQTPVIAGLPNGGFVVAWTSTSVLGPYQDGSLGGIYAQRFDAAGEPAGFEFLVNNTFTAGRQHQPAIAALQDNSFVVTWSSPGPGHYSDNIYAQRYNAGGGAIGGQFQVNAINIGTTGFVLQDDQPAIAALTGGGFVIAWTSDLDPDRSIYIQRYAANGSPVEGQVRVNTTTVYAQSDASITAMADGGFAVSWTSDTPAQNNPYDVYVQFFKADGQKDGPERIVNSSTAAHQNDTAIAGLVGGNAVVVWSSDHIANNYNDVYSQLYSNGNSPDLDALDLTLSNSAVALNGSVTVKYSVTNVGNAPVGASTVGIYRSMDQIFDENDVRLATRTTAALAVGASVTDTFGQSLTVAGHYFLIAVGDDNRTIIESSESNNPSNAGEVTVTAPAPTTVAINPDSASKAEGTGATPTHFTFTVTRTGTLTATSEVFWKLVDGANPTASASDFVAGTTSGKVTFNAGETSKTITLDAVADATIEPTEFFGVTLFNAAGAVIKASETTATGTIINDDQVPAVDLDAQSVTLQSGSLTAEQTSTWLYNIANHGTVTSGASSVAIYQSADAVFDASDVKLGSKALGSLGAGASVNDSMVLSLTTGSYYLIAVADSDGVIVETDESNNPSNNAFQVIVSPAVKPKLAIESLDANKVEGSNGGITPFTFTVTRTGDTSGTSTARWEIFAGQQSSVNVDDFVGPGDDHGRRGIVTFGPGETEKIISASVGADTTVEADELFGVSLTALTNAEVDQPNATANGMVINDDGATAPDLDALDLTLESDHYVVGSFFSGTYRLSNIGDADAAPSTTGYFRSTDAIYDASDVLLDFSHEVFLTAGETRTFGVGGQLNTLGTYYIIAVADYPNAIAESNETNNPSNAVLVTVVGAESTPPQLVSLDLQNVVDVRGGTAQMTNFAGASDDSGIDDVTVWIKPNAVLNGNLAAGFLFDGVLDPWADHFSGGIWNVGPNTPQGFYIVDHVDVRDIHGNQRTYTTPQLAELGVDLSFYVLSGPINVAAADVYGGTFGVDNLVGTSKNNALYGLDGNDTLIGGFGYDVAFYSGNLSSYVINRDDVGGITVSGLEGTDTLSSIELLKFADISVSLRSAAGPDFNGDGNSDLLFSQNGAVYASNYQWQFEDRAIQAQGAIDLYDKAFSVQVLGDFDGDGRSDVLFQNPNTGGVWVWLVSSTSIVSQGAVDVGDASYHLLGAADFDGNGTSDLLFRNDAGFVYMWKMDGLHNTPVPVGALDPSWHIQGAGDFDGDGRADILLRNISTTADNGAFFLWRMDGNNVISGSGGIERPPTAWKTLALGDFDGDGKTDFAVRNVSNTPDNGAVWVYLMDGTTIKSQGAAGIADAGTWHVQQIGDYNGDSTDDILFRNDTGYFYSWNMAGTQILSEGLTGTQAGNWADPLLKVVAPHWDLV